MINTTLINNYAKNKVFENYIDFFMSENEKMISYFEGCKSCKTGNKAFFFKK